MQLSLYKFQVCTHCNLDPGTNKMNQYIWAGFYDSDTKQHVCWGCRKYHYEQKEKAGMKGLFSETPVMV